MFQLFQNWRYNIFMNIIWLKSIAQMLNMPRYKVCDDFFMPADKSLVLFVEFYINRRDFYWCRTVQMLNLEKLPLQNSSVFCHFRINPSDVIWNSAGLVRIQKLLKEISTSVCGCDKVAELEWSQRTRCLLCCHYLLFVGRLCRLAGNKWAVNQKCVSA